MSLQATKATGVISSAKESVSNYPLVYLSCWQAADYSQPVMIPIINKNQTYFLSIVHITKQAPDHLIYGILINENSYYLGKTIDVNDCLQLDNRPKLDGGLIREICTIITSFENVYKEYPSLDFINYEIIKSLASLRKDTGH